MLIYNSKLRKILKELVELDEQIINNGGEPRKSIFSPVKPIDMTPKQEENKGKSIHFNNHTLRVINNSSRPEQALQ